MKLEKELRERLHGEFLYKQEAVNIKEIICFLKTHCPEPKTDQLIEREYAETARRFITDQRDARGRRRYYSANGDGIYVNVELSNMSNALMGIRDNQVKLAKNIIKNSEKVLKRRLLVDGKISQQDWEEYLGERVLFKE